MSFRPNSNRGRSRNTAPSFVKHTLPAVKTVINGGLFISEFFEFIANETGSSGGSEPEDLIMR